MGSSMTVKKKTTTRKRMRRSGVDSRRPHSGLVHLGRGSRSVSLPVELLLVEVEDMGETLAVATPSICGRRIVRVEGMQSVRDLWLPCNQVSCGDCEGAGGNEEEENNDDRAGQGSGQRLQGRRKNNAQGGQRKRAKKSKAAWRLDEDGGPPITEGAGLLLSKLLAVFGRAHRQDLEEVLTGMIDGSISTTSHDMASVIASIKWQTNEIRVRELHLMLSLIQLALNVDSLRADNKLKCLPRPACQGSSRTQIPGKNSSSTWPATTPGTPGMQRRVRVRPRLILTMSGGTMLAE
ncbi:hypothetical protein K438DRAFT_1022293 [Mycena galopus ATCC 62051]|nr:hypothetical protein K438DRAFT_1022293 [Mycena galopus ATCC 62051]